MGKEGKIKTVASKEPARLSGDAADAVIKQAPGPMGNNFDVRMSEEPDGLVAAKKIVDVIKRRGICLVEANAPPALIQAASDEAEFLLSDGHFAPPFRVHDDRTMMEAKMWQHAMPDEEKVVWLKPKQENEAHNSMTNALMALGGNMTDFAAGLMPLVEKEIGLKSDRNGHPMLSCYTGDRNYTLHLDNAHSTDEEESSCRFPDNGQRLTAVYFLNTHWDPDEESCEGGLDVHLTDPTVAPASASTAKNTPKLRIAPHADTLALFLSERMAHQVIATKDDRRWFCMTIWTMLGSALENVPKKLAAMRQQHDPKDDGDG